MNGSDAEGAEYAEGRGDRSSVPSGLVHGELTQVILGAFYAAHTHFGHGFLEPVYANAVALLLRRAGFRVERELPFDIEFHGEIIGRYRADVVVESKVVVEIKAARAINQAHTAQVLNYLRASRLEVGLLLNFGPKAEFRRVVSTVNR